MAEPTKYIYYVTDVEGNLEYFKKYIELTTDLCFDKDSKLYFKNQNSYFVYGGDVFDKGDGDIRLCYLLINFKKDYPDRVFLIIGNRDLNKIKLTSELEDSDLKRKVSEIPPPYWFKKDVVTFKDYIKQLIKKNHSGDDFPEDLYSQYHTRVTRLKWLLQHTMGAPDTFENRRKELAILHRKEISDEEVANNFYESVSKPDGFVRLYLDLAQLIVCIGNTLFVHGSINSEGMGFIPDDTNQDGIQETINGIYMKDTTVQEWVACINQWVRANIEDWKKNPTWNFERTKRGGTPLMGYSYIASMKEKTVLITHYLPKNSPEPVKDDVRNYLHNSGIFRVVVGHKPFGDTPTIILDRGLEIISADQSFSDPKSSDKRGDAVASVVIEGTLECNSTHITGTTKDKRRFDFFLPKLGLSGVEEVRHQADHYIGKKMDNWWIKAKLENGDYLLSHGQDNSHEVYYDIVSREKLDHYFNLICKGVD